jgi:hypothetical protein
MNAAPDQSDQRPATDVFVAGFLIPCCLFGQLFDHLEGKGPFWPDAENLFATREYQATALAVWPLLRNFAPLARKLIMAAPNQSPAAE